MSEATSPSPAYSQAQKLLCEFMGTMLLVTTVIGSGIMAERLAGGNIAIALLGNTIPTGAMLVVLISLFGPLSGAHFNPIVSAVFALRGENSIKQAALYSVAQIIGGLCGTLLAHAMFSMPLLALGITPRTGIGQWIGEICATFTLLMVILGGVKVAPEKLPMLVGLTITAAYWFTSSTSFANPAVTIARAFTPSFSGIAPSDVLPFIVAQMAGAGLAALTMHYVLKSSAQK
jgi:glycerol uptake facilitator-like aquaporin